MPNPVERISLVASGDQGQVYLDEIVSGDGNNEEEDNGLTDGRVDRSTTSRSGLSNRCEREQLAVLHSSLLSVRNELATVKHMLEEERLTTRRYFQIINANIKRVAHAPARPILRGGRMSQSEEQTSYSGTIALSSTPRTLYDLWDEWTIGIGGRKPARYFTAQERGRVKHKFSKRKNIWDLISRLVQTGLSAHVAVDKIYVAYGRHQNVSKIIAAIQRDKKANFIPPGLRY